MAWLDTYGRLSATHRRRLSIADRWILTTADRLAMHVVTEDSDLFEAAVAEQIAATLMTSEPRGAA